MSCIVSSGCKTWVVGVGRGLSVSKIKMTIKKVKVKMKYIFLFFLAGMNSTSTRRIHLNSSPFGEFNTKNRMFSNSHYLCSRSDTLKTFLLTIVADNIARPIKRPFGPPRVTCFRARRNPLLNQTSVMQA